MVKIRADPAMTIAPVRLLEKAGNAMALAPIPTPWASRA